jgi:hypothetical protein
MSSHLEVFSLAWAPDSPAPGCDLETLEWQQPTLQLPTCPPTTLPHYAWLALSHQIDAWRAGPCRLSCSWKTGEANMLHRLAGCHRFTYSLMPALNLRNAMQRPKHRVQHRPTFEDREVERSRGTIPGQQHCGRCPPGAQPFCPLTVRRESGHGKAPHPTFCLCAIPLDSWCPARITRHTFAAQEETHGEGPAGNASIRPFAPVLSSPEKDCLPHVAGCCHDGELLNPAEMEQWSDVSALGQAVPTSLAHGCSSYFAWN